MWQLSSTESEGEESIDNNHLKMINEIFLCGSGEQIQRLCTLGKCSANELDLKPSHEELDIAGYSRNKGKGKKVHVSW